MKLLYQLACSFCALAMGMVSLTSCEGSEMYSVNTPNWVADKIDSIKNAKSGEEGPLYTIGKTDFSSGWWQDFSRYYVIPEGQTWEAVFDLHIDANATNTYKNFALIITSDSERGGGGYKEYGAIRYDHQPSGNSEWGDHIDRNLVESNLTFSTATAPGIGTLEGTVVLTVDRSEGGLIVTMDNGTVKKTYTPTTPLENLNNDKTNTNIRCFIVVEGSFIDFLSSNIEPYDENADFQPASLKLAGVPTEVLLGTTFEEFMANVSATVEFEGGSSKNVELKDLQIQVVPDMTNLGTKTLVAIYNKTSKGSNCDKPVVATVVFNVVKELSAFTETVVVPTPLVLGAEDNSSGWWSAHTENIKVEPKETKVVNFTNYSSRLNNWNNFVIVLNKASLAEYAVVRADNFGWGAGYEGNANLKTIGGFASDEEWAAWREAMDGAKVTAYITNNGDGTADIKAVMVGNNGVTYTQEYNGISTIDPDDMFFRFTVDGCHLVFDHALGTPDCTAGWWSAHTANVKVPAHTVCTVNFTNYSSGANNWNNFVIVLNKANLAEYAVVRADNYGWGAGYEGNANLKTSGGQADWGAWLAAMNGAKCTAQIVNNGDGTADIKVVMHGTDGKDYVQDYIGINTIDPDDLYFRFTVDSSYLVFE